MKIGYNIRLIYIAAGVAISLLVLLGLSYLKNSASQFKKAEEVEHTYNVLANINLCEKVLIDAEASQCGYFLTAYSVFSDRFHTLLPMVDSTMNEIQKLTADNDIQQLYFIQLTKHVKRRMDIIRDNFNRGEDDPQFLVNIREGTNAMENCRIYMAKMRVVEERLLQERTESKNYLQGNTLRYFRASFITAGFICILLMIVFVRELGKRLIAQQRLRDKVSELSNSKTELEEITFAASHDLQEPMRKIRILSTLMVKRYRNKIEEEDLEVVHRVNAITEQMHLLLNDLVQYTNLLNSSEKQVSVSLYEVCKKAFNRVLADYPLQFNIIGQLPQVKGAPLQLETMFVHLFDNSLKFRSPDRELTIDIYYELIRTTEPWLGRLFKSGTYYHQITVQDNGIGFERQYQEKIFGLFQRLHSQNEFEGKGVGLSIARRVMINHQGVISASRSESGGASFRMLFPVTDKLPRNVTFSLPLL